MNNTQKRIKIQHENQEKEMQIWWNGYWEKLERYNEPESNTMRPIEHCSNFNELLGEEEEKYFTYAVHEMPLCMECILKNT